MRGIATCERFSRGSHRSSFLSFGGTVLPVWMGDVPFTVRGGPVRGQKVFLPFVAVSTTHFSTLLVKYTIMATTFRWLILLLLCCISCCTCGVAAIVVNDASPPPPTYFGGSDHSEFVAWLQRRTIPYQRSAFIPSPHSPSLGIAVYWTIQGERINIAVAAKATGWVGFGA
jgi:hypothetical protein